MKDWILCVCHILFCYAQKVEQGRKRFVVNIIMWEHFFLIIYVVKQSNVSLFYQNEVIGSIGFNKIKIKLDKYLMET